MANLHITPNFIVPNYARVGGRQTDRGGKKGENRKNGGKKGKEGKNEGKGKRKEGMKRRKKAKRANMLFFMFQGVPYLKTNLTSALRNYY